MEYARKNNKQNGNIVCSTQTNHKTVEQKSDIETS